MTRGDRLGHSWRAGQLKFPGLASDFAAMIRAALALYEATGKQTISTGRSPGSRRSIAITAMPRQAPIILTAADAEGLIVRPNATTDEATPNHNAVAAQNLVRLAFSPATSAFGKGRPAYRRNCPGRRRQSLYAHGAVQRRRCPGAHRRDRSDWRGAAHADPPCRSPHVVAARSHRVPRRFRRRLAGGSSGAVEGCRLNRRTGLRLHRPDLFAATDRSGGARRGSRCGATS